MTENGSSFCESDVRSTYRFLAHAGRGVTEVRVISPGRGVAGIGYFDNEEAFVDACSRVNGRGNVYVGIQPRPPRLLEQATNRIGRLKSGACDDDIEWLTSVETQERIGEFRHSSGEVLFHPNSEQWQ